MRKFYGIEILRFLTSISVLIYHYRHFFAPYNSTSNLSYFDINVTLPLYNFLGILYEHGIFGVHVFYTISGFVFAHIYLSTNKSVSSKNFFINRFGRLYPLHFATLCPNRRWGSHTKCFSSDFVRILLSEWKMYPKRWQQWCSCISVSVAPEK